MGFSSGDFNLDVYENFFGIPCEYVLIKSPWWKFWEDDTVLIKFNMGCCIVGGVDNETN